MTGLVPRPRPRKPAGLTDPTAVDAAVSALASGGVVAHGFANFYALATSPDLAAVQRMNLLKGRPAGQTGSITLPPARLPGVFDWTRMPDGAHRDRVLAVADLLFALGPIGLRGPAAAHVPEHLTAAENGVRTVQVIGPGYACPSHGFLAHALARTGHPFLAITSANRSRRQTGAAEEPAHWQASHLRAEFDGEPALTFLEHHDEPAARRRFPHHQPMSTTVVAFRNTTAHRGRLIVERQGSLPLDLVERTAAQAGFDVVLADRAATPLRQRSYHTRQPHPPDTAMRGNFHDRDTGRQTRSASESSDERR